ncbi:MAG TPA: GH1 family beta-glucosidase [Gemmatimonadales bacterium]|nr:GH1 family beta-glucosidase [Gemmatimonadales bacterium]
MSGLREEAPAGSVEALAARFPPGFAWGVSTSAYQIEGAVEADGRGASIWDVFSRQDGRVRNGDSGATACDHYHRSAQDVELMAGLGVRAYRFSVSWPRVMPSGTGEPNARGLDFYDRLVDLLLVRGIRPVLNLYHWDLPQALQDRGGWANPDMPYWFATYAAAVAERVGDRVQQWLTINEPQVFAFTGHATGRHAPGLTDWPTALRVADAALRSHAAARDRIRALVPGARVGVALDLNLVEPASPSEEDTAAAARHHAIRQRWFLDPLFGGGYPPEAVAAHAAAGHLDGLQLEAPPHGGLDFLGVNYYTRETIRADADSPFRIGFVRGDGSERTTMDWEVHPDGLSQVLRRVIAEYAPQALMVTENGAAFPDVPDGDGRVPDEARRRYLEGHVAAAADAIDAGVPLEGYFVWSLLDNFEWDKGFEQRFGIVRVDYRTQRRTLKASGEWYRELLAAAR